MSRGRRTLARSLIVVSLVAVGAACSTSNDEEATTEQDLAEQLVAATEGAGVAPRLTTDVAEALYGTDAASICDAFEGGTTTAADLVLRGNQAQGRRKTITDEAVVYAGLVVQTYCPDVLDDFHDVVSDIDPFETDR